MKKIWRQVNPVLLAATWGETYYGHKTQSVFGADGMLQNSPLKSSRSVTIGRQAQDRIVQIEGL